MVRKTANMYKSLVNQKNGVCKHLESRIRVVSLDIGSTAPRTQWDNEHYAEDRKTFFLY